MATLIELHQLHTILGSSSSNEALMGSGRVLIHKVVHCSIIPLRCSACQNLDRKESCNYSAEFGGMILTHALMNDTLRFIFLPVSVIFPYLGHAEKIAWLLLHVYSKLGISGSHMSLYNFSVTRTIFLRRKEAYKIILTIRSPDEPCPPMFGLSD